jgi:hypothetical protein
MDTWQGRGGLYIHRLHSIDEYIIIFIDIEEYNAIYSLVLYFSFISSIN